MITVLFLIPTLDRGGAENVLVELVNHMDQDRFRITVQTLFDRNSQKERLREGIAYKSFLYHQFHGNSRLMARIPAGLLYRLIVRGRYDVVISYLEGPTAHIISGCPYADSRKVAWIHSAHDRKRGFSAGFVSETAAVRAYQSFDKIVCVAKTVKNRIEETIGTRFENACILYNAINTEEIRQRSQEDLGGFVFPDNEISIISAGKVIPVKGYDRLARVQKKLVSSGYKTHVYILGEGNSRNEIEVYVKENGIAATFTFLGFQDNPYRYVAKADLFVCSSRREGFSTAVSEALVLGVPVVSTNCSGAYELLGNNNEYGIVTENSEEALFEGIRCMIETPGLLSHYCKQAQKRGLSFNSDEAAKQVEGMLESLFTEQ